MEDTYQWSLSRMEELSRYSVDAYEGVRRSLMLANRLVADIEADSQWLGEHKAMFEAWMHLLQQYHKLVGGLDIGVAATIQVNAFIKLLHEFYATSPAMAALRSVS